MLFRILAIDDLTSPIEIQSLMAGDCKRRLCPVVLSKELLNIFAGNNTSSLIVEKWCRITFQNAYVEIFPQVLQCDSGKQASERAADNDDVFGLCRCHIKYLRL